MEEQTQRKDRDTYETKAVIIAVSGFILSVFFILWAFIVLVRFYVFENILYNLFLLCMLTTGKKINFHAEMFKGKYFSGVVFNLFSINLMLTDLTEFNYILPFVVGSPVSIFWTILSILLPIWEKNFYSQFAFMPIALYSSSFYDGFGYNPNNTTPHPFAKPFTPENSFFEHTFLILVILVIAVGKFDKFKEKII